MRRYYEFKGTREFVHYALNFTKGHILDLGSGRSKYRSIIAQHGDSFKTLDVVPGPGVDIVSSIESTPFADGSLDTIYCTQVFEHIPKPWLAVEEIRRILAPGGMAIIMAPFLQAFHADPNDYFRYTLSGLESLFDHPDFEIIESGAWGGAFSVIVDMIHKRFFSAYGPQKRYTWRFLRLLISIGHWLDRFAKNHIVYLNTYVLVRKKLR